MESPTERAIYTVRYAIATMPVVQRGYNFEQASYCLLYTSPSPRDTR